METLGRTRRGTCDVSVTRALIVLSAIPFLLRAQSQPPRAVRLDLPRTPSILKAYANGTRDSSGAPGRRYWQQRVDYRVDATLDAKTAILHGAETITIHNTSPDTLKQVVLRLYQNYFRPEVQRDDYVTDITDGITIERLKINGDS